MYKRLSEESIQRLMEAGIEEFAEYGLDRAAMSRIADRAKVSVGVIYKYYEDKDDFFLACVQHSLKLLENAMEQVIVMEGDLENCIENLVHTLIREAKEHPAYYVLYNEITSGSCKKYAKELAKQIESSASKVYEELFRKAQEEGRMAYQGDSKMMAFFFDNLLMMLQFSFSCQYYKERMKIFCGDEVEHHPEEMGEVFIGFVKTVLGV